MDPKSASKCFKILPKVELVTALNILTKTLQGLHGGSGLDVVAQISKLI